MEDRETADAIDDRAAAWVARLDQCDDDPLVRAELDAWLAGDDRRRGAFFRAEVAWTMLDRARAVAADPANEAASGDTPGDWVSAAERPGAAPLREAGADRGDPEPSDPSARPRQQPANDPGLPRRRLLRWGGGAVAASLIAGVIGFRWRGEGSDEIQTALGEIRRVPLSDGSLAAVNTSTRMTVALRLRSRVVRLDEGEAWFEVAKDPERPFIVEAGNVRARAVGTAFSVRRTGEGALIQVTEGRVAIWRVGDEANAETVGAGSRAFVSENYAVKEVAEAQSQIDRSLAWRSGQLVFDGDTLGEAAQEFNRYNAVQIRIDDPALAAEKLVGRFRTNEPDAFARAASAMLDADAQFADGEIRLDRR